MKQKQIVLQPGLAPNQHVNCFSLKHTRQYTTDSRTRHHAQAAKQTVRVGGGLFPLCLWTPFLTTVKRPTVMNSPEQQAANPPPAAPLPSPELCHLTAPAGSWANTKCLAAAQQLASKRGLSICMCTAYPAQQGQNKTCLLVSAARLGF